MLYLTNEMGSAVSSIIKAVSETSSLNAVEIILTSDELITAMSIGKTIGKGVRKTCQKKSDEQEAPASVKRPRTVHRKKTVGKYKGRGTSTHPVIYTYDGESMDAKGWAKKVHVSTNCIRYRFEHFDNPYGQKGPTDADKILVG